MEIVSHIYLIIVVTLNVLPFLCILHNYSFIRKVRIVTRDYCNFFQEFNEVDSVHEESLWSEPEGMDSVKVAFIHKLVGIMQYRTNRHF